jgi:hypothetical protein
MKRVVFRRKLRFVSKSRGETVTSNGRSSDDLRRHHTRSPDLMFALLRQVGEVILGSQKNIYLAAEFFGGIQAPKKPFA